MTAAAPVRADWWQAAALAAGLFLLYAASAPRGVQLEDDALFVLASRYLGAAHPPGYPLHVLLGHVVSLLPGGTLAYRLHLLSGFAGALACAALWLCARALTGNRPAAWAAALVYGLSGVFWSQSVIAEVYTLNALFTFALAWLALERLPRALPAMALLFGLSLANHWPLMLLVAPAFAALLWPQRGELLRRLPLLAALFVLGLAPYAALMVLSWRNPAVAFYGPLESLGELWRMVSRAEYATVDRSPTATLADQARYFGFLGEQLLVQLAFVGTALAALGAAVQRRELGVPRSVFLTAGFLLPSVLLLLLLGFDYDARQKHMFHVYPLPAYGFAALWLAVGFAWLAQRAALRRWQAAAAAAGLAALAGALGARENLRGGDDWPTRYAEALLDTLPQRAVVFTVIEAEFGPLAYYYFAEGRRADLELRHPGGLLLGAGKRLFHPLRTDETAQYAALQAFLDAEKRPLVRTQGFFGGWGQRDQWLFIVADKGAAADSHAVDVPPRLERFFEESVLERSHANAWVAEFQGELRRRYATLLMLRLTVKEAAVHRHVEPLSRDFLGALGLAEGLLLGGRDPQRAGEYLERALQLMPSDAPKYHRSRVYESRGHARLRRGDRAGAIDDLQTALRIWPHPDNGAAAALATLAGR